MKATAIHRGSFDILSDANKIIEQISVNEELKNMWLKYQKKFTYSSNISYGMIIEILEELVSELE